MIIEIKCPNCNFSKKVPQEKIPEGIKYAKCPSCNNTFELPSVIGHDADGHENEYTDAEEDTGAVTGVAVSEGAGFIKWLFKTLKGLLFSPSGFFVWVRREEGIVEPISFGILLGSIGFMFDIFWEFLLRAEDVSGILETLVLSVNVNNLFIVLIIISPFLVLASMLFSAVILHFCLFILRGAHRGFLGTLRVSAYGSAALIFCLIPYVGEYIAFIWWLFIMVTGLREVHETSTLRILLSLLLPLFMFLMLAAGAAVLFISSLLI
ncbi:MAG: zinc-ribbon domain-containing protein [Deltaproteobacteria bacterium]|nr:zinc-ribbon domain-containing protein [Deltaproteobacteria bacterium]